VEGKKKMGQGMRKERKKASATEVRIWIIQTIGIGIFFINTGIMIYMYYSCKVDSSHLETSAFLEEDLWGEVNTNAWSNYYAFIESLFWIFYGFNFFIGSAGFISSSPASGVVVLLIQIAVLIINIILFSFMMFSNVWNANSLNGHYLNSANSYYACCNNTFYDSLTFGCPNHGAIDPECVKSPGTWENDPDKLIMNLPFILRIVFMCIHIIGCLVGGILAVIGIISTSRRASELLGITNVFEDLFPEGDISSKIGGKIKGKGRKGRKGRNDEQREPFLKKGRKKRKKKKKRGGSKYV